MHVYIHQVVVHGAKPDMNPVISGVPQGIALGPIRTFLFADASIVYGEVTTEGDRLAHPGLSDLHGLKR